MRLSHEFGPVYDKHSRVLILGSFPSVKSRELRFYYGHPQNRFWPLIAELLGEDVPQTVEEKRRLVLARGIALWDVIESCEIEGSADSSIRNARANDLTAILREADIRLILTNGKKADALYRKHIYPVTGIEAVCMPSTSPANAAWSMERLHAEWSILKPYCRKKEMPDQGAKRRVTFEEVYEVVRMVPRGKVATYGQIASILGNVRWARVVGYALHDNPDGEKTPCYRIVNKAGKCADAFVFGGRNVQIDLLRADGIPVSDDGYVQDMEKYQWNGIPPADRVYTQMPAEFLLEDVPENRDPEQEAEV